MLKAGAGVATGAATVEIRGRGLFATTPGLILSAGDGHLDLALFDDPKPIADDVHR
jgi:hypothetical protein